MLQAAERKARFTDQFMCRRADADETGHTGDAAVSYSEVKAGQRRRRGDDLVWPAAWMTCRVLAVRLSSPRGDRKIRGRSGDRGCRFHRLGWYPVCVLASMKTLIWSRLM
jgi:hypothetical protein